MLIYFIVYSLPKLAVPTAVLYLPFGIFIHCRYGKQSMLFHALKYALLGNVVSLICLTILYYPISFGSGQHMINLVPFIWVVEPYTMGFKKMAEQLILNVGMFIPLGLLLPLAVMRMRRIWVTLFAVLGTTLLIESVQFFIGRSADIDDVITNFLGGAIGYLCFMLLRKFCGERPAWRKMTLVRNK